MANYARLLGYVLPLVWVLVRPDALRAQLLSTPVAPQLSEAGYQLILDYEVGGGQKYYDRFLIHPEWPGAASGITAGIGYDMGYNSAEVIRNDWRELGGAVADRLSTSAGITGQRAHSILYRYRDISVPWRAGQQVFDQVTLARFYSLTKRTYPGFDELRPNAQAALVSLVFNRGPDLTGERRREMRNIKSLVPKKDYEGIARELRAMKRIWAGSAVGAGLIRRREAEAVLVLTP